MKFKIESPNESFSGIRFDIKFKNGIAASDNKDAALELHKRGYKVTPNPAVKSKTKKK